MNQTERIADGRRRFFAARGEVVDVLMRARKGHQDVGLERGRDYEIEAGGVSLRRVPSAGTVITILTGDRVSSEQVLLVPQEVGAAPEAWASQEPKPSPSFWPLSAQPDMPGPPATVRAPEVPRVPAPVASNAGNSISSIAGNIGRHPQQDVPAGADLDRLKAALFASVHDTNDAFKDRTAAWQDGLAMLTAMMLAAPDYAATKAAMLEIEGYLGG